MQVFSTASDNQTTVTINVLQGEREFASDNRLLGRFDLQGIKPAQRGLPQIGVKFRIDVNGILEVSAVEGRVSRDKENDPNAMSIRQSEDWFHPTGLPMKIEIKGSGGLSKEEIDRMKREAEAHAAEDKKRREVIDLKNQAEASAYQVETALKDHGGEGLAGNARARSRAP